MKSATPSMPWADDVVTRVFTSRSNKNIFAALTGVDKRIFRFSRGDDHPLEDPEAPTPSAEKITLDTHSLRLFCSRFIRVREE